MKSIITMIYAALAMFTLGCLVLSPGAQAVTPAPDGGYPGGNTAEGQNALLSLTTGGYNTGVGFGSLQSNIAGNFNTGVGAGALLVNTADRNTAIGTGALLSNTTGTANTANGASALFSNTTASYNTAIGNEALFYNTTGSANTAIGVGALSENTAGSNNTALGVAAGENVSTANNVICIGAAGANVSNTCFIGNIYGVTTLLNNAAPVLIDSDGNLGTASSSRRYKTDIKPIDKASESILALKPVSFRYKVHRDATPHFGLIAEDVAQVDPNLVVYDADGKPYTLRYDPVNAMLLNEFLKEHRQVQEQQATIAELRSTVAQQRKDFEAVAAKQREQIQALTVGLQKVSTQLEVSQTVEGQRRRGKRAMPVALNNPSS